MLSLLLHFGGELFKGNMERLVNGLALTLGELGVLRANPISVLGIDSRKGRKGRKG